MDKKDKIAILVQGKNKPMGTFIKNYLEYLPQKKIVIFGGTPPYFYKGTSLIKQKIIRYFMTLIAMKNEKKLNKIIKKRLKKIIIKEKPSCVFAEFLNTGASAYDVCKDLNIPIISTVFGYEIHKKDVLKRNLTQYQQLAKYSKSKVIPVAKNMIPILKEIGFSENQIIYSPVGAKDTFFDITPNHKSHHLLAIGRFTPSKSPDNLIRAFSFVVKKHPNTILTYAGNGELLESAQELAKKLGIINNINFIGWINTEQQIKLLSEASIFIQHSITAKNGDSEGTPVAIIEASASGLPVVSTMHGGIVDVIIHGKTGFLVKENDWKSMGEKIIYLLENPLEMKEMGKNGKQFIYDNFSMRKHSDDITKCINSLIK